MAKTNDKASWNKNITVDAEPDTVPEQTQTNEPEQKKTSVPGKPLPEQRISNADWEANKLENNTSPAHEVPAPPEAPEVDVAGRSDVQTTANNEGSREVTTFSDVVVALNEIGQQSSAYGDEPLTINGKKITSVSYDAKKVQLKTSK